MSKILLYHGVTDWKKDKRRNFSKLQWKTYWFVWIWKTNEVVKWKQKSSQTNWLDSIQTKRWCKITFDDSYENLYHKVPILKNIIYQTFLFQQDFVDDLKGVGRPFPTNRFYWTDIVDYFVNYSNEEKTKLDVYGKEYNLKTDEGKIDFVEDVKGYLKNCSPKKRDEFIQGFKKEFKLGIDMDYTYPDIQNLSWEQIKELMKIHCLISEDTLTITR